MSLTQKRERARLLVILMMDRLVDERRTHSDGQGQRGREREKRAVLELYCPLQVIYDRWMMDNV